MYVCVPRVKRDHYTYYCKPDIPERWTCEHYCAYFHFSHIRIRIPQRLYINFGSVRDHIFETHLQLGNAHISLFPLCSVIIPHFIRLQLQFHLRFVLCPQCCWLVLFAPIFVSNLDVQIYICLFNLIGLVCDLLAPFWN